MVFTNICRDLNIFISTPTLFCDNSSAIFLASNTVNKSGSKYIDTDFHFIREIVKRKALILRHVLTENQLDLFTKALGSCRFLQLSKKIGMSIENG